MDFLIGILLMICVILILINFTSVSMSDSNSPNQQRCTNNSLFSSLGFGGGSSSLDSGLGNVSVNSYQIPQPILASAPSALNNKVNLEQQTYDYHKYFFVN